MNARQEIDSLVKTAQMKPRNYFSGMQSYDPELAQIFARRRTARQQADNQRRQFVNLSQNRQMVPAPSGRLIRGSGWTGSEVRQGGSAPNDTVSWSQIRPRYATNVAMPGPGGKGRFLAGGGKLDVGADGRQKATVGGKPVVRWEDLESTKKMMAANNPSVNTPSARRDKMLAYMPNSANARPAKATRPAVTSSAGQNVARGMNPAAKAAPPSTMASAGRNVARGMNPAAKQPAQSQPKFDFRGEAKKLLGSFKNEVSGNTAAHGMVNEMARRMSGQLKGVDSMSEAQQRQLLDQWKSQVSGMRSQIAGMRPPQAPANNVASASSQKPAGTGTVKKTTLPGGAVRTERRWQGVKGSPGQPTWASDALAKVDRLRMEKMKRDAAAAGGTPK